MSHQFQPFHPQNRSKVAVVTGGNKGVGYSVVRKLLKKFRGDVFLTARNEEKGLQACEQLKKEGLHPPKFYLLDITDREQIMEFRHHLQKTYGGIDVLINNASVPHKSSSEAEHHGDDDEEHEEGEAGEKGDDATNGAKAEEPKAEEPPAAPTAPADEKPAEKEKPHGQTPAESYLAHKKANENTEEFWVPVVKVDPKLELAEMTMKTNVVGTLNVIHCLLPLFRMHGRVINISSSLGVLSSVSSEAIKEKLCDSYLLETDLIEYLKNYVSDVKDNTVEEKGWPKNGKTAIDFLPELAEEN